MDLNDPNWTAVVVTKGGGSGYLVFAAVIITGTSGGKYYWYWRREVLLVFATKLPPADKKYEKKNVIHKKHVFNQLFPPTKYPKRSGYMRSQNDVLTPPYVCQCRRGRVWVLWRRPIRLLRARRACWRSYGWRCARKVTGGPNQINQAIPRGENKVVHRIRIRPILTLAFRYDKIPSRCINGTGALRQGLSSSWRDLIVAGGGLSHASSNRL